MTQQNKAINLVLKEIPGSVLYHSFLFFNGDWNVVIKKDSKYYMYYVKTKMWKIKKIKEGNIDEITLFIIEETRKVRKENVRIEKEIEEETLKKMN